MDELGKGKGIYLIRGFCLSNIFCLEKKKKRKRVLGISAPRQRMVSIKEEFWGGSK